MRNHNLKFGVVGVASGLLLVSACSLDEGSSQGTGDGVGSAQQDNADDESVAESALANGKAWGHYKNSSGVGGATADSGAGGSSGIGGMGGTTGAGGITNTGGTAGAGGVAASTGGAAGTGGSSSGTGGSIGSTGGSSGSTGGSTGTGGSSTGGSTGTASCATQPAAVPGASGKSIVVALTGNDTTGAGTLTSPVRTLKRACAMALPGDKVEVRGGTYNTAGESCSAKGTVDRPVHVRPYAGEKVLYEASGRALDKSMSVIQLTNASYVVLDGFEVANSSGRGVFAYECTGANIRNMRVHDTQHRGIGGTGQDLVFENNEVWNVVMANANGAMGSGGWSAAVATWARADGTPTRNVTVRNNYIHDSWGECIIALFADDMTIQGNRMHDCYSVSTYVDNSRNVRIERNQIWVTGTKYNKNGKPPYGIMLSTESYSENVPQQRLENVVIANNLITNTGKGISYWHTSSTASYNSWLNVSVLHNVVRSTAYGAISFDSTANAPAPSGGVIANNVVWAGAGGASLELGNPGAWKLANNVWPSGKPSADTSGTGIAGDPGMVSPVSASTPDGFRLQSGSACAGKGAAAPLATRDFWCATRSSTAPSIGVHEP